MSKFLKQLLFISLGLTIILVGGLAIYSATPSGSIKMKPSATAKIKMVKQENTTTTGNNPVGWWKFDETTAIDGSTLADSSGNGNTGTLSTGDGSVNKSVAGKLGKGLSFDGGNDYVGTPTIAVGTGAFTMSLWANIPSLPVPHDALIGGASNYAGLLINGGGGFSVGKSAVTPGTLVAYSIPFGKWIHIVAVVKTNTTADIYVNGIFIGTSIENNVYTLNNRLFNIGCGFSTADIPYTGLIDDVRIYNRALSAGEVAQMYNSTKDGYLGNIKVSTGLVGYWKLDDNNALTSVIDYSGKGNTGTAYSGTATSTSVLSTSTAMVGRAMSFDGGDDWVQVADNANLHLSTLTVEAWVKSPPTISTGPILVKGTSDNDDYWNYGFHFSSYYGESLKFNAVVSSADTPNKGRLYISSSALSLNTWYHVAMTYNGGTNLKLFINGISQGTVGQIRNFIGPFVDNTGNVYMGKMVSSTYFNGLIDEVKIWNYARSAKQIYNDYNKGLAGLQ